MSFSIIPPGLAMAMSGKTTETDALDVQSTATLGQDPLKALFLQALEQSLQEATEGLQNDDQSTSGWLLQLPMSPQDPFAFPPLPLDWQSGTSLPMVTDATGKDLPLEPGLLIQTGQATIGLKMPGQDPTAVLPEAQLKLSPKGQTALFEGLGNLDDALRPGESLRVAGGFAEHYSTIHLQTGNQGLVGKGGMPVLAMDVPVGHPQWDKALGERIQWMIGKEVQQAELKLTPPNLGPLEVRVSLHNDQANVSILAAHAPAREALEAALPRLREMFGEASLNLVNVDVGQRGGSGQGQPRSASPEAPAHQPEGHGGDVSVGSQAAGRLLSANGMVDDYA